MAEQLGFQEILGQGRAIDRDKRREAPPAVEMKRARDQFLAGAALAQHQYGAVAIRHPLHQAKHLLHGGGPAHNLIEAVLLIELAAQVKILGDRLVIGERPPDAEFEVLQLKGFLQVIEGSLAHRLHGRLHRAETGDDNHHGRLG